MGAFEKSSSSVKGSRWFGLGDYESSIVLPAEAGRRTDAIDRDDLGLNGLGYGVHNEEEEEEGLL